MASISTDKNSNRRILFCDPSDGKRKTVYLGSIPVKAANEFKVKAEALIGCKASGSTPDAVIVAWVNALGDDMHAKLAGVGLVSGRDAKRTTFKDFLDDMRERCAKESTRIAMRTGHQRILAYFGESKPLADVTRADADDFRAWLRAKEYAGGTVARTLKYAKAAFRRAVRTKMLSENPFDDMKMPSSANPERMEFITKETIEKVIAACPNATWRAVFAFARYGGVRVPSEIFPLTWADVLWAEGKIRITSPKTEHHEGKGERWIPLFAELRPYLEDLQELAEPGAVHVFDRAKLGHDNLGVNAKRIIRRAGLTPWAKTFVNLRSSRETELMTEHPAHVVVAWIGNSLAIAQKHYLQVTDADFAKAAQGNAESDARPTQNATQHAPARMSKSGPEMRKAPENPGLLLGAAHSCLSSHSHLVGVIGFEPMTPSVSSWCSSQLS
jgi:integrase